MSTPRTNAHERGTVVHAALVSLPAVVARSYVQNRSFLQNLAAACRPPVQAALCCIRILRHLPEHVEDFMERIMDVLKERHHGVQVAGVQLITAIVASNPQVG